MIKRIEVNDVLMEFLAEYETLGEEALRRYVEKYPELAETLQRRAGLLRMFAKLPETELTAEQEQKLDLRAASVVQNLIFEVKQQSHETGGPVGEALPDPKVGQVQITSLLDRLTAIGETFQSVAKKLRLSDLIVEKLDKRRIRPESVPRHLYERLAEILSTTFEEIYSYAMRPPLASGGHYKAASAPAVENQPEFSELVKWDPDMSETDKNYWLDMSPAGTKRQGSRL
jgi:hypothetical protein